MRRFQSCAILLAASVLLFLGARPVGAVSLLPISFENWTVVQYGRWEQGPARWILSDQQTKATQVINADPSILRGDFLLNYQEVQGTWRVNDTLDNDLMGFSFGFVDDAHFYLFDWKNEDQFGPARGTAFQGMTVKRVQVDSPLTPWDLWPTYPPDTNRVFTLYHNQLPWHPFTDYQFTLESFPGVFVITVRQGEQLLAQFQIEDPIYPVGYFGLYNSSQEDVEYRAFTRRSLAPLPTLLVQDVTLPEGSAGASRAVFTLTLSQPYLANPVSVLVKTADGSALAGSDYEPIPPTRVVFEPGQTQQQISIPIVGDAIREPDEDFRLEFSEPIRVRLARPQAIGTIWNDDTVANQPPLAAITQPHELDRFTAPTVLLITASAADADGSVTAVDFYQGETWIGRDTDFPYQTLWSNAAVGTYTIRAIATDNHGDEGTSAPVQIFLDQGEVYADIAILRSGPAPEIDELIRDLAEMNLTADLFDQDGLSSTVLRHYRLVIWDDVGVIGLTEASATILAELYTDGIPVYLIGEHLAAAAAEFSPSVQDAWFDLLRARPVAGAGGHGVVETSSLHPVIDGPFGTVISFPYSELLESLRANNAGEELLGHSAETEVLLAAEDSQSATRSLTQDLLVWDQAGACGQVERKRLFKNAVWWLIKNPPLPRFMNLFLGGEVAEQATQGAPYALSVTVVHNGELAATDVTLSQYLPAETTLLQAVASQGSCTNDCGVITCHLGLLAQSEEATVTFTIVPATTGVLTHTLTVSSSEGEARTVDNILTLHSDILPSFELNLLPNTAGLPHLRLDAPAGFYAIEASSNLVNWWTWTNLVTGGEATLLDLPENPDWPRQFYRARRSQ